MAEPSTVKLPELPVNPNPHNKWRCTECDLVTDNAGLLTAPNPFDPDDQITGCPKCKSVDSFNAACSTDLCSDWGTCGGPGADGVYRTTCGKHADWLRGERKGTPC